MDELAAFKGASADLIEKEKELLKKADIVFTGGKSLYESKKQHHANVHCFPSSVDREHFEKTMSSQTHIPDDLQNAVHPTIGFYGVIDERIDLELLDQIAEKLPTYTFIMIGPIVKIDPNSLPKRANIVYPGGKKYEELPNYLKGIDIAMMPFALNKSTQFISPTKTLEYMAAHKPIVSTPIYDVVRDYKDVVKIAGNADEFAKAIEQFVYESQQDMAQREEKEKKILTETSWDKTVTAMSDLMHKELEKKGKEIPINTQKAPLTDYFKVL
jgi:glycosyltransferase involved in cell wall biosynthesis